MGEPASLERRLDEVLSALPDGVATGHHQGQRLVVSNGGVFVLDPLGEGSGPTKVTAESLATLTRDRLAERLRWVPFVDWFDVTDGDATHSQLPVDLIAATVLEGHSVDDATLRRVSALLEFGELSPPWCPGLPDRLVPDKYVRTPPRSDISTF